MKPLFSIIIPTRDRPATFKKALNSVVNQTCPEVEIIVVDDGSEAEAREALNRMKSEYGPKIKWFHLERRPGGHGSPFARNYGVSKSEAQYIGFLDDDDLWTDPTYLENVTETIADGSRPVDAHFSNQRAYKDGVEQEGPVWIESLTEVLVARQQEPDSKGVYEPNVGDLIAAGNFCHLNNLILRRTFFWAIGGLDESLRYEPDRDLYLRVIDAAVVMKYSAAFVSQHNIPDSTQQDNVSTVVSIVQKRLYQLHLLSKASLLSTHPSVRAYARRNKGYTLKKLAEELLGSNQNLEALHFALQGLGAKPTFRWMIFSVFIALRVVGRSIVDTLRRDKGQVAK